ncbi:unnamed protein product [Mortierella alpina]
MGTCLSRFHRSNDSSTSHAGDLPSKWHDSGDISPLAPMAPLGDLDQAVVEDYDLPGGPNGNNNYPGGPTGDGSFPGGPTGESSFPGGPLSNERFIAAAGGKKSGRPAISAGAVTAVTIAIGGSV